MIPRRRIIPIFVPHQGCPNQCVFCNQNRISGSPVSASGDTVRETLAAMGGAQGYELAFYGGSFTAIAAEKQEELLSAAQPYRESGLIASIRLSTRPDAIDEKVIGRLQRFGVETVELGSQSMTDEVLRLSGRGHTAADTVKAAKLLKAAGFKLILQMMTGLPGETPESSLATARALAALEPDGVRIYPTVVVKNTPLAELWARGEYREHTVEDAVELCAAILPIFEAAGIPVIRLGLNPTEELSGGAALAGAYHPALGELVLSRRLLSAARAALAGVPAGAEVCLAANPSQLSAAIGQHRANISVLMNEFSLCGLKIISGSVKKGEIVLQNIAKSAEKG